MLSKNRISEIRKLHQKKYRDSTDSFIVEGTKSLLDIFNTSIVIKEIFATEAWLMEHKNVIPSNCITTVISENELDRISSLQTPQKALALVSLPKTSEFQIDNSTPLIVLDNIKDPGNLGTIIRTADWFGFKQIICSPHCVELTNPKTIQASMGSFARVQLFYLDLPYFFQKYKGNRTVLGATLDGTTLEKNTFYKNDIIVIGSESTGLNPSLHSYIDSFIRIPSSPLSPVDSLNASVATGILLYHFYSSIKK